MGRTFKKLQTFTWSCNFNYGVNQKWAISELLYVVDTLPGIRLSKKVPCAPYQNVTYISDVLYQSMQNGFLVRGRICIKKSKSSIETCKNISKIPSRIIVTFKP